MPDITMCTGENCNVKEQCHRFTATPTPGWQAYFIAHPVMNQNTCSCFWDNKDRSKSS